MIESPCWVKKAYSLNGLQKRGGQKSRLGSKMKASAIGSIFLVILLGLAVYIVVETNTASAQTIRVACVGDSITEGSGYPDKLQLLLGSNYTVSNFGVSGSTVSLNSSLPYMNQTEFRRAEDFNPDIVVIMLGTNDAQPEIASDEDNFEADYSKLVYSFKKLEGNQLIWIVKSPPIFSTDTSYNNTRLVDTVFSHIDKVADQLNLPTVDVYSALSSYPDYFFDGVHPNPNGASVIASNVYDAITLPDGSPDTSYFDEGYFG
jgi:lysophospholipase L1-like esterase